MPDQDLKRLGAEPTILTLTSGIKVNVVRMQTRQFFRLIKIFTRGVGPSLISSLNFGGDTAAFGSQLLTLLMVALPEAEDAAVDFVNSMCEPHGLVEGRRSKLSKADSDKNRDLWAEMSELMFNPAPEDTISVLETVVAQEGPEIQELGKRLAGLWKTLQETGALKAVLDDKQTSNGQTSEAPTLAPSTS